MDDIVFSSQKTTVACGRRQRRRRNVFPRNLPDGFTQSPHLPVAQTKDPCMQITLNQFFPDDLFFFAGIAVAVIIFIKVRFCPSYLVSFLLATNVTRVDRTRSMPSCSWSLRKSIRVRWCMRVIFDLGCHENKTAKTLTAPSARFSAFCSGHGRLCTCVSTLPFV
jgi:hypothetical protein